MKQLLDGIHNPGVTMMSTILQQRRNIINHIPQEQQIANVTQLAGEIKILALRYLVGRWPLE